MDLLNKILPTISYNIVIISIFFYYTTTVPLL